MKPSLSSIIEFTLCLEKSEIDSKATFKSVYADNDDINCLCLIVADHFKAKINPSTISEQTLLFDFMSQVELAETEVCF